ncbi:MAG: hypothetical protein L6R30_22915 [Thermoanaerobaculia bacterium]|nr:hypothetical protein [Thermoanaerobaculia bacterium]
MSEERQHTQPARIFETRSESAGRLEAEVFRQILAHCSFPGLEFVMGDLGDGFYLQVAGNRPDAETGRPSRQAGRKWYVSRHSVPSEVVQTAFLAVLTWLEHEARESFTYRGARIFSPHFDADFLARFLATGAP